MLKIKDLCMLLMPMLISVVCIMNHQIMLALGLLPTFILIAVVCVPSCDRYESLWIFVLTVVSTIPVNILLIKKILRRLTLFFHFTFLPGRIILGSTCYLLELSIEVIVMLLLSRIIWRSQRKIIIE